MSGRPGADRVGREAPHLVRLANRYADRGVPILGVNTQDTPAEATEFVRRFRMPYSSIDDSSGRALRGWRGSMPANAIPTTVVVDRQERVAVRTVGKATYSSLEALISDELSTVGSR